MIKTTSRMVGNLADELELFAQSVQGEVAMAGVAAMARVVYDEAKARVPQKTGRLHDSIYRVFSPEKSDATLKTYRISYNKKTAPHGHLIEFGHWTKSVGEYGPLQPKWVPAHPFLRPAFDKIPEAIRAGRARMAEKLKEAKQ